MKLNFIACVPGNVPDKMLGSVEADGTYIVGQDVMIDDRPFSVVKVVGVNTDEQFIWVASLEGYLSWMFDHTKREVSEGDAKHEN